ncbi:LOB domain-containing protein 22-like [Benincasa hispida]|uniref:LOB domain-containing protein 22-like n=1 Tax=Benincasa hispida TaxID=102211 RepID=UPI0019004CF9|nr:LOB domain-containing protein 22-like [Benincasa hispida]
MNICGGDCSGTAAEEGEVKDNGNLPSTACAACKFQRRKCSADCPLAPYFPAHRLQDFQNVRKLFGVKNVLKTLADLEPDNRFKAVECMIFEANCRASDLAGGCYKIIAKLQSEITLLEAQHRAVLRQLRFFRQTTAAAISQRGSILSELDFDCKPGLTSLLLDCDYLSDRLNMMENEVSFPKALTN